MKRYANGTEAPYGLYLSSNPPDATFVGSEGEVIDGQDGATYVRVPTWLLVVVAPLLGGAFVVAFPALVLATILWVLGSAAVKAVSRQHAYVVRVGWQPAMAHFKKGSEAKSDEASEEPELQDLEAEVSERAEAERTRNE
jgi:hypothetical protein